MTSNSNEPKQTPDAEPNKVAASEPIPQWKLAAFLPLPFLIGGVSCLLIASERRGPTSTPAEMSGFFVVWGVCALIAYVVAVVILGFFGHALGLKIYPVRENDS